MSFVYLFDYYLQSQYQFIHDVLAEEILTGFSEIFVTSIPEEFKKLQTSKANGEKAMLKMQYEVNYDISIKEDFPKQIERKR